MKCRMSFVSNSSSSSFCIIGLTDEALINDYIEAAKLDLNDLLEIGQGGVFNGGLLTLYGPEFYDGEGRFYYAGIDAEDLLSTMTIPKACEYLQKKLKKDYKLNIPLQSINFHYGEVSN